MKVEELFDELKEFTINKSSIFKDSGVVNCFQKMDYGFFPLGWGILKPEIANKEIEPNECEIEAGGLMVLGNDFGTVSYVKKYKNTIGEADSVTIINLFEKLKIDTKRAFFTNFYLGIRLNNGRYSGTTMTKRMLDGKTNKLTIAYKELCYSFFLRQVEIIKPHIVICLGHDVKNALIELGKPDLFKQWKPKSSSMEKLYKSGGHKVNNVLDTSLFVVSPHPCYLSNFKDDFTNNLNAILADQFT